MKCRTGLMRLSLINKDDTLVVVRRLLNFPIHQMFSRYVRLVVHLEGDQTVYYEPDFLIYVTDNALGRMSTVHPNNREAFRMRLLLHHVRGPISFEDLKTVIVRDDDNDILEIKPSSTYTEAC
ncbi:hypothetical protein TNCV_682091 [Trichonephila clavipes]|nr:hypothetical protein TNCV_682091 [Trichonephila clavipes]